MVAKDRKEQILEQFWVRHSLSSAEEMIRDHEIEIESIIFSFPISKDDVTKEIYDKEEFYLI